MILRRYLTTIAALVIGTGGCSLALDFEALQSGEDTDTTPVVDTTACTSDLQCVDNINCTNDICSNGDCLSLPDNTLCGPLEICDVTSGCVPSGDECTTAADCNDGVGCTVDTCQLGKCYHNPDHSVCEDPDLCIINEACDPVADCKPGVQMICEQTDEPCMKTVCESATGECVNVLISGADDDKDTYLDEDCGGDDCNDKDPNIHPLAKEICNNEDNNCDGMADIQTFAGPEKIAVSQDLYSPAVSFDGTHYSVVWQQGTSAAGSVHMVLLDTEGQEATPPVDFTNIGGGTDLGSEPDVVAAGDRFYAVWSSGPTEPKGEIKIIDFRYDTSNQAIEFLSDATVLGDGQTLSVRSPEIRWDQSNTSWAAAWIGAFADQDEAVLFQADNHVESVFIIDKKLQTVGEVGLATLIATEDNIIIAYSSENIEKQSDARVTETRIGWTGSAWEHLTDYPAVISPAQAASSRYPVVAAGTSQNWWTGFASLPDEQKAWNVWNKGNLDASAEIVVQSDSVDQTITGLVSGDTGLGLLYIYNVGTFQALDFRTLQVPVNEQTGRLDAVMPGQIRDSRLAKAGNGFAAVWVTSDGQSQDTLKFLAFYSCSPEE